MIPDDLQAYHKTITDTYDMRSSNHDNSVWHRTTSLRLLEELPPGPGDCVLDIATGTGTIAYRAAELVGQNGKVVGIDLSEGMLSQANAKLAASGLRNLEFVLADAENLKFPSSSFDRIYCASAFFWILDPLTALKHWHNLLKPGGSLGFHALPDTSYVYVREARRVLEDFGITYVLNTPTGTEIKCRKLLMEAGFHRIRIREEKHGHYIPLEHAQNAWIKEDDFSPGQYPNPLTNTSPDTVLQAQRDYEARIEELNTDEGVWNDISMYYVYAEK